MTVVIVGNGPITSGAESEIAAASLVVRFNECRSFEHSRGRTDVVAVCNTGRPGRSMLSSSAWRDHPAVRAASEIWCVRHPIKFAELRQHLALSHPELGDFCDDYTGGFEAYATSAGKACRILSRSTHDAVELCLSKFAPPPYVVPSSGLIVIAEVIRRHPGRDVAIVGFSHEGWEWHPFSAERGLVDAWVAARRVRRGGCGSGTVAAPTPLTVSTGGGAAADLQASVSPHERPTGPQAAG